MERAYIHVSHPRANATAPAAAASLCSGVGLEGSRLMVQGQMAEGSLNHLFLKPQTLNPKQTRAPHSPQTG